jgi:hypothetical protein
MDAGFRRHDKQSLTAAGDCETHTLALFLSTP